MSTATGASSTGTTGTSSVTMRYSALDIAAAIGQHPPTDEQRAVIEAPQRPLLVVAGAGSGKTETMASRVVWLVANGVVEPDEVLGLTFTRKAAGELAERIGRRLRRLQQAGLWEPHVDDDGTPSLGDVPTVSTYHAYAGRLVGEHGLRLGIEPESRLLSEAAAWQIAHEAVVGYDGPMQRVEYTESTVTAGVVALAGELAEHLVEPEAVVDYLADMERHLESLSGAKKGVLNGAAGLRARHDVLPIVRRYAELKRQRSALDFADQMAVAARLARRFPQLGGIERQRFRAVLLDEFQDTSEAQLVLLRSLFVGGDDVPVTAVGDPHQSIYGWRGASATTLASFREQFADAQGAADVRPLSTSWRNDAAVLTVSNSVAAPLRAASEVPVHRLQARDGAGVGQVQAARLLTSADEAALVGDWIRERWFDHDGRHADVSAAVLCRKRSQFPAVGAALEERGIPYEMVGLGGLLTQPEVNDLVSLLWVVQDPGRGDRLMRLLTGPVLRLGPADLDGLAAWSRELMRRHAAVTQVPREQSDIEPESREQPSIVEALDELPDADWCGSEGQRVSAVALRRLRRLAGLVARLRSVTGLSLTDLVSSAEQGLGLDLEVRSRPEHTASTARVHLDAFTDVAAQFSSSADRPTLGGFLDWLEAAEREERGLDQVPIEVEQKAVQVLTVHAAKGLEWDVVAVPGLVEASFPAHNGASAWNDDRDAWVIGKEADPDDPESFVVNDSGWLTGLDSLPFDLRGDVAGLPELRWAEHDTATDYKKALEQFRLEAGAHAVAEERRLAYVAFTRARRDLLLTAHVWGPTTKKPRVTSRFLTEVLGPDVQTLEWADAPPQVNGEDPENPQLAVQREAVWPVAELPRRRQAEAGAALVRSALEHLQTQQEIPLEEVEDDIFLLLRERDQQRRPRDPVVQVPRHLSTSAVVSLASDPDAFALRLRRPMPQPPAPAARRGTAFHAWVEQHFSQAALVDLDELPGAGDEDPGLDDELPHMKERFLASEWATRVPEAIEVAVETVIDGIAVRGRVDAVFREPDGRFTVVDWKTGRPPSGETRRIRALQLAAYRVAYARLREVDLERVDACFYYAGTGETDRPPLPGPDELATLLRAIPG